jgi:hypothetical protein
MLFFFLVSNFLLEKLIFLPRRSKARFQRFLFSPAVLWNPEFVQAEELFNQPFDDENCLRDNRYCSLSPLVFSQASSRHGHKGIVREDITR